MSDQNFDSVVVALHKLHLCARCILRFVDERDPSAYEGTYQSVAKSVSTKYGVEFQVCSHEQQNGNNQEKENGRELANNSSERAEALNQCTTCLGILQQPCEEAVVKKIENAIVSSGFEFEDYTFAVTIPLCCLVRQHSLFLYLREKFSGLYADKKTVDCLPSIKEVFKWVCGPALGMLLGVFFKHESCFQISIIFGHDDGNTELEFLCGYDPSRFKERKARRRAPGIPMFSISSIRKALEDMETAQLLRKHTYCPPLPPNYSSYCTQVFCSYSSILLAGRYNKYSRTLPQTPWVIDGERKLQSSVQEKICDLIIPKIKADDWKFSSGGREDIDVRMLGTGRPFVVELINPRKTIISQDFLADIQKEINTSTADVAIRDLQIVTKEDYLILKVAENTKTKTYSCVVWTEKEINQTDLDKLSDIKDLVLQQKTPLRVLHRRPLAVREKMIHEMSTKWKDNHHFALHLKTKAGTYVKEFVHGDFGRTIPNLGMLLGVETDILELDVESVDVDWPPSLGLEASTR